MLPDLMRPPGYRPDGGNCRPVALQQPPVAGQRLFPLQRQVNLPLGRQLSRDHGQVDLAETALSDKAPHNPGHRRTLGKDDGSGGAAIQPVDRSQFARGTLAAPDNSRQASPGLCRHPRQSYGPDAPVPCSPPPGNHLHKAYQQPGAPCPGELQFCRSPSG